MRVALRGAVLAFLASQVVAAPANAANDSTSFQANAGNQGPSPALERARTAEASASALVREMGQDLFAGSTLDATAGTAHIYVTQDRAAKLLMSQRDVVATVVKRSYGDLIKIRDLISNDIPSLQARGISAVSWVPNVSLNKVDLVLKSEPTPGQAAYLNGKYGDQVSITVDSAYQMGSTLDRWSDSQPWSPGDNLNADNGSVCSQGPTVVKPNGGKYALTAGHCGGIGTAYSNGVPYTPYDPNRYMGSVTEEDVANNGRDTALIYSDASRNMWRNGNVLAPQVSSAPLGQLVGDQVCFGGALSGEMCGATIVASNGCFLFDTGSKCNVTIAQLDHIPLAGPGDSGGPTYDVTGGSGINVRGIITGVDLTPQHAVPCYYWFTHRVCSDKVAYTEIGAILPWFGVSLYT